MWIVLLCTVYFPREPGAKRLAKQAVVQQDPSDGVAGPSAEFCEWDHIQLKIGHLLDPELSGLVLFQEVHEGPT